MEFNWIILLFISTLKFSSQDVIDHRGKEFIVSFVSLPLYVSNSEGKNILYISSFENTTVDLYSPFLNPKLQRYTVFPKNIREIVFSGNQRMQAYTGKANKGIRLKADKEISMYGVTTAFGMGEAFLVFPVDVLDTYYIVPTFHPISSSIIQVTATENNTEVIFRLKLARNGRVSYGSVRYRDGDFINVTLNALEVFQVLGESSLEGTVVTSSKPIALFSGNDCTMIPYPFHPCNQLVEQIPPVQIWGQHFITSPTPNSMGGDLFHIIASSNNTDVYVDRSHVNSLQEGLSHKFQALWNQSVVISTSKPSLVVQYTKATGRTRSPAMSVVPPTEWSANDFSVYVEGSGSGGFNEGGFVNVIINTSLRKGLRVRGPLKDVPMNWNTVPGGFSRVSLNLSRSGLYHVFHKNPLANFTSVVFLKRSQSKNEYRSSFPIGFKFDFGVKSGCSETETRGGDNIDNDCDGRTDEELANGKDDDGDGRVDEDLFAPPIEVAMPKNFVTPPLLACSKSFHVAYRSKPGFFPVVGMNTRHGVCAMRGNIHIMRKDKTNNEHSDSQCLREIERIWTIRDACQNEIVHSQLINIFTPRNHTLQMPRNMTLICRSAKYLKQFYTGEVSQGFTRPCKGQVNITFMRDRYIGNCASGLAKLERTWKVEEICRRSRTVTQIITLEARDRTSTKFRSLSAELEQEMDITLRTSSVGNSILEIEVLSFSNGSINVAVLIKMDMKTTINQQQLLQSIKGRMAEGVLGKFQVDYSSIAIQDFDECQSPDLNKCHEKAFCTNTPGAYNCTCVKGYFAPPFIWDSGQPISSGVEENVTLRCHARGYPKPTFFWITPEGDFVNATRAIREFEYLDDDSKRVRGKLLQNDGSLLLFNTRVYDSGVYKCVAVNVAGESEGFVNVTVTEDIVEVVVAITLEEEVFDAELENKSSARYQEMKENVEVEVTLNGSVKVRFRVIVKVDKTKEKEPSVIVQKVGKTLSVSVKEGKLGDYKVKPVVEFKEVPPPPKNVKYSDVTERDAMITWSHPELYNMYAINGYSLQFKKFGSQKWSQFVFTLGEDHRITDLEQDTPYFVRLKSENEFGRGLPRMSGSAIALATVLPLLSLIILGIAAVLVYRRWKKRKERMNATDDRLPMNPITPGNQQQQFVTNEHFVQFSQDRYAPIPGVSPNEASTAIKAASFSWREIPRHQLTLGKILGEGEFGMVLRGELAEEDGSIVTCAVKKLKRSATESDFKDLLNELEIMCSVGKHPNLVNLIGACSANGPLMILVEFAEHGNLLSYLRENRKQNYENMNEYTLEISAAERLKIACDVCDGMSHLAAMKCAHRDLAARNILLAEGMVAKVSDFGLSRDIYTDNVYEKKTAGKLPAKWMAMESLEQGIYTSRSDVWSFGVLLWEIETGGCAPYAGMVVSELYAVMLRCWKANPQERTTFDEMSEELHQMYQQTTDYLGPQEFKIEPDYENTSVEDASSA
ncbi:Angiopoietin-1 receptor [Acropora cervicornis]|uniref:receptor protein-tyrosine kinase n=1 Tax=Acropora cervicornis TaxID=6130 RepID=A0AAD9V0I3_ACRCE|nr:Angiopoietin-1 receptor [Acropora cervicornis]